MRTFKPTLGGIYESPSGKRFLYIGPTTSLDVWFGTYQGQQWHAFTGLHQDLVLRVPKRLGKLPSFEKICANAKIAHCGPTLPITAEFKHVGTVSCGTAKQACQSLQAMAMVELNRSAATAGIHQAIKDICRASVMATVRPYGGQLPITEGPEFAAFKPYFQRVTTFTIDGRFLPGHVSLSSGR